jgi:hypothetical protein
MRKVMAMVLCAATCLSGCATAGGGAAVQASPARDAATMAGYVQRIPVGSAVRVGLADGRSFSGTLMRADDTVLVVQPKGRVPEAPLQVPMGEVQSVELRQPSGMGKVIAIGAAAGAAATFGVLLLLYAMLGGD